MKSGTNLGRFGVFTGSLIVLMLMAGVVGKAAVTLSTPNCTVSTFTLAPGATSAAITPPVNTAVMLTATDYTPANFSVGSLTVVHVQSKQIRWIGLESPPSAAIVKGAASASGTHMLWIDYAHKVDLEILSADQFIVHNGATTTETTAVKMIW